MTEEEHLWLSSDDPNSLLSLIPQASLRRHLLYAVAASNLLREWLIDARSREIVDTAEAFADGEATLNELEESSRRASTAAGVVGGIPARTVALVFYDLERNHRVGRRAAERGVVTRDLADQVLTACLSSLTNGIARSFAEDDQSTQIDVRHMQIILLRDIFGNPFRPVAFDPNWRTSDVTAMARGMYETRDFAAMPILADALQDAGCENVDVLDHCRGPVPHVRGCWVVDQILEKA